MRHPEGQIALEKIDADDIRQTFVLLNLKINTENHLVTVVALLIATVLLCTAFVNGFSSESLFGGNSFFLPDVARNTFDITYVATAIGLIVTALLGEKKAISFMRVIGKVYILVSLIGFMKIGSYSYNEWISIMNLMYGLTLSAAGSVLKDYRHDLLVARLIARQICTGNYEIMDTLKKSSFGYRVLKKNFNNKIIDFYEDSSDTSCIKGEFI